MSVPLNVLSRVVSNVLAMTTAIADISVELEKFNNMLKTAESEGRELNADDWAKLDADLEAAREKAKNA